MHVQNLAGDTTAYHLPEDATVADLKGLVRERTGSPARLQRLILSGDTNQELADSTCTLAACGVENGATLHLFVNDKLPFDFQFERAVGSYGSDVTQFDEPVGVCVLNDTVFVSDNNNHRVQALHAVTLEHLFSFGNAVQLDHPRGICSSGDHVFVADPFNRRIQTFRAVDGEFVCSMPLPGRPFGVCASSTGEWLCVSESDSHSIHVLRASNGTLVRSIGSGPGGGEAQFHSPCGLSLSPEDELLFVADLSNHRIKVLRFADGAPVRTIGGSLGNVAGYFAFPTDVRVSASGEHLLVGDLRNHRVQVLTLDGVHVRTLGSSGSGEGQFSGPSALCESPAADRLYVLDEGNARLLVFSDHDIDD